ncbi:MAG: hypothetical protein OXR62_13975 [Ahrensia sp.]|nr:hypothetical protein [Ahrensia sp.]
MKRVVGLLLAAFIGFLLYYTSRFWTFRLWDGPGLFGIRELPPQGGLFARWLRGTDFTPFELVLWAIAAFLLLTMVQKLFDALFSGPTE